MARKKSTSPGEDEFLPSILERPDDDIPRLVYADWLEERGDPRGAFIRLQCQREPLTYVDADFKMLLASEAALLREHETTWLGAIPGMVDHAEFRRGFVESVRLSASKFLRSAPRLFRVAPVRVVQLTLVGPYLPKIALLPQIGRLRELNLSSNAIGSKGILPLVNSPHAALLQSLQLNDCALGAVASEVLAKATSLAHLRSLGMARNTLGDLGVARLAAAPHLASLRELNLRENQLGIDAGGILADAPHFRKLTRLSLGVNHLGNEGVTSLANSPILASLQHLDLHGNQISTPAALALARSPHLGALRSLDLRQNRLSDRSIDAIIAGSFPNLRGLDLEMNDLGEHAARALLDAPWLDQLVRLNLGRGRYRPETIDALRDRLGDRVRFGT
jgi:uncharacterized protein (TIGR02996 family)